MPVFSAVRNFLEQRKLNKRHHKLHKVYQAGKYEIGLKLLLEGGEKFARSENPSPLHCILSMAAMKSLKEKMEAKAPFFHYLRESVCVLLKNGADSRSKAGCDLQNNSLRIYDDRTFSSSVISQKKGSIKFIFVPFNRNIAPIYYAVFIGDIDLIHILADAGADLNIRENTGMTPLFLAAALNRVEVVQALILRGARPKFVRTTLLNKLVRLRPDDPSNKEKTQKIIDMINVSRKLGSDGMVFL